MAGPVRVTQGVVAGQPLLIIAPQPHNPWGRHEWFEVIRPGGSGPIRIQEMRLLWNVISSGTERLDGGYVVGSRISIPLAASEVPPTIEYWDGRGWALAEVVNTSDPGEFP